MLDRLLEISALFQQDMERAFEGTGLTTARTHLLWVLAELGPSTQQALATAMRVSPRNVTGLVDALDRTGHVRRGPHPTDRRANVVSLTDSGQVVMSEMAADHERLSAELMAAVDASDADGLRRGVDAIATRLRAMVEAAASTGEEQER